MADMNKDACYYLGYVSKTRGLAGNLLLFLDVDDTGNYAKLDRVLVDMHGTLTPFFFDAVWVRDGQYIEVHIEDIDSREAASALVGKELFLPLDSLPVLPDDQYYLHELVGMTVTDARLGELGKVDKVFDQTNNPLMQILHPKGEILIPIVSAFVVEVDKQAGKIAVDLPEGLVDINFS